MRLPKLSLLSITPSKFVDWPGTWALAGLGLGLGLSVSTVSAWLVVAGLTAFAVNLSRHSPLARNDGYLFSAGPAFLMAWILGLVLRGWAF